MDQDVGRASVVSDELRPVALAQAGQPSVDIMAAVTQGQSDLISERNKSIAARLRKLGRPRNGNVGLGYRLAGPKGARYAVADERTRAIMAEIVYLRDEKGWTWDQISESIESRLCEYEGRPFNDGVWRRRVWSFQRCHNAYHRYKQILQEEGGVASEDEAAS
jgi:hypothetical protein